MRCERVGKSFEEEVMRKLISRYGNKTELEHENTTELFVATFLSPQCTDKQVNSATVELFKRFRSFGDYADADQKTLGRYLRSINFYKTKAKNLRRASAMIVNRFHGKLPGSLKELMELPGVGRKVANIILTNGLGIVEGIAIDTHAITVANRLRLTRSREPGRIESDLMRRIPRRRWGAVSNLFVALGKDTCKARKKECYRCVLRNLCPSSNFVDGKG